MTSDTSVTANFAVVQYTLTPVVSPSGAGTITPSVPTKYDYNKTVSVTASPATGYQFTGWSGGGCSGTGPCNVTMTGDTTVTATFAVVQYTLTPAVSPSGAGTTLPLAPTKYNYNTTVIVTATPAPGYQFTGWSGGCTVTPCTVLMTSDKSVTASFAPVQYTLTTGTSPSTGGTVTPATGKYNYNTTVIVTATAATGYQFTGWTGGGCNSANPCTVTMTGDQSVTANFEPVVVQQFTLTLTQDGTGTGSVGALPTSSTGRYDAGTTVSVTATPKTGCKFVRWSGACSGTGGCSVTMNASKNVAATFELTTPCDDRIADLQKNVAADKRHGKYGLDVREALRLYAAAQTELAKARAKVGDADKRYLKALREFNSGKAALCDGRYWRAAHEFWEAYQIAHKILEHYRR
jgi:xyloglucan-specific exo-beta-1,4-glucanase